MKTNGRPNGKKRLASGTRVKLKLDFKGGGKNPLEYPAGATGEIVLLSPQYPGNRRRVKAVRMDSLRETIHVPKGELTAI